MGAGIGFVGSYSSQVASNMHNGMSFFDAVYYKNINWNQVGAATVAGGVAGATGFMAGGAVNGLVGGMLTPATTTAGAIVNGVFVGATSGFVSGAVAGGAGQLAYNALTPCTNWDEGVLRAIGGGAVGGGIIGGAVGGIAGGWQFRRGASALQEMAVDDVIRTADDAAAGLPDEMNPVRCSFEAETPVLTDDGLVPISEIEEHQYAWAYNEETGEFGFYPIVAVWAHEDPVVLYLTIDGETIATTPNHPFYTADGEWVQAGDLQVGDEIRDGAWQTGTVESLVFTPGPQTMYNFTVATAHTYVVGQGQWVVHNECPQIHWDSQGKHIPGHKNYRPGRSPVTHSNPQALIDEFAGTGNALRGTPGQPGYKEWVNFGEEIGFFVDETTGIRTATTNGVIHYSSRGVHIVPARP